MPCKVKPAAQLRQLKEVSRQVAQPTLQLAQAKLAVR
jgi:hypothetical protein